MIIDNQREKAFEVREKFPHIPLSAIELWIEIASCKVMKGVWMFLYLTLTHLDMEAVFVGRIVPNNTNFGTNYYKNNNCLHL